MFRTYDWTCTDCKRCSKCDKQDEDDVVEDGTGAGEMIFCDYCDRGFHLACVQLPKIPEGPWHCPGCEKCVSCGAKTPSPTPGAVNSFTSCWIYMKLENDSSGCSIMLCRSCGPLFREKKYCPKCFTCYSVPRNDMVKCWKCSKWIHFACHESESGCKLSEKMKGDFVDYHEKAAKNVDAPVPKFACVGCSAKISTNSV
jgi:hypothetical protein